MTNTETTLHLLGRCQCGYALSAQDEAATEVERYRDMETPGVPYKMGAQYYVRCPERHKPFKLFRIEGEFSDKFQCDARCENAKGYECKCSCGGMNHGKSWMVQPTEIVSHDHAHCADMGKCWQDREPCLVLPAAQASEEMNGAAVVVKVRDEEAQVEGESAQDRFAQEEMEKVRHPTQHIGVEGEKVYFTGKLENVRDSASSTLYVFTAEVRSDNIPYGCTVGELIGPAKVEWWKPDYVNVDFKPGEVYNLKAKVKAHKDDPRWGKATVVTYLEVIA